MDAILLPKFYRNHSALRKGNDMILTRAHIEVTLRAARSLHVTGTNPIGPRYMLS